MASTTTCFVCQDAFSSMNTAPRLLPCLHLTCATCLEDMATAAREKSQPLSCLNCEEKFSLEQAVLISSATASDAVELCQECTEPASIRCICCSSLMCVWHEESHRRSKRKTHDIEFLSPASVKTCSSHVDKMLSAFCEQCQILVCIECICSNHQGHVCSLFNMDCTTKCKDSLRIQITKLGDRLPQLEAAREELNKLHKALTLRLSSLIDEINNLFDSFVEDLQKGMATKESNRQTRLRSAVAQRTPLLQQRINELEQRRSCLLLAAKTQINCDIKLLEAQQHTLSMAQEHIVVAQRQAEPLLSSQALFMSSLHLFNVVAARARQLLEMELIIAPVIQDTIRFCVDRPADIISANVDRLGIITRPRDYATITKPCLVIGSPSRPYLLHLTEDPPQIFGNPSGVAQLDENHLIVADCSHRRLKVFLSDGKLERQIEVSSPPFHIAVTSNREIWVAAFHANALLCYSSDGVLLRQIACDKPHGVAVSVDGTVVATSELKKCVKAFAPDGTERWTSATALRLPYGVAVTPSAEVLVCDSSRSRIQVLSLANGRYIRQLAFDLDNPQGIAVIPHSNQIVVTEQASISIWTYNDVLVRKWGQDWYGEVPGQFKRADGVAVMDDGRIAVADCYNHRVQIF